MSDDLDLRCVDQRHEPDPQFRAALRRRLVAIMDGSDPVEAGEAADVSTIELDAARRPAEPRRVGWTARGAIAIASAAAIVTLIVIVSSRDDGTTPADTPSVSTSIYTGWLAFSATDEDPDGEAYPDEDVYVGRVGSPPRRLAGSDTDEVLQVCPAFSPDRSQLVFGQAGGSEDTAYHDAALVIADVTAEGGLSEAAAIPLEGEAPPPCGLWSADGRWVAFGVDAPLIQGPEDADGMNPREPTVGSVDEVWVVDTESGDVRRLTGLFATDLEWATQSAELAIIGDGISLYSVESDEIRPLGGAGAQQLDWSPDGRTIAFTRDGAHDIWLMDADGTNERLLVSEINANHGVGPVWSPDGEHIVYQQLCDVNERGGPCREEHEVVLITVNQKGDAEPASQVLPPPQTAGPDGPISWYPLGVVWRLDGAALLYWAWPDSQTDPQVSHGAIVAVPVDGTAPPVILSGDLTPSLYFGP